MKTFCKNIDITDKYYIRQFVEDCIYRHYKRHDFRKFLYKFGLSKEKYDEFCKTHNKNILVATIIKITRYVSNILKREDLSDITPVKIKTKYDKTCNKTREIGCECPLQQILDFIAVGSCKELFDKRIVPQQCASIEGRGQLYGVKMIKKWVKKDNCAINYSKIHGYHYHPSMKYFVKLDIEKCFPSMRLEYFMKYFGKDCKNKKILWLWESLLSLHIIDNKHKGFIIGSLISQWATQYVISFIYRFAMSLHKSGKNNYKKKISHMLIFMDDILITGSNRKELLSAVQRIQMFSNNNFGLNIKNSYHIKELIKTTGIDMMGYVVYRTGKIAIRSRNFIKMTRVWLRWLNGKKHFNLFNAKRITSFYGYFKHTDNYILRTFYNLQEMFYTAFNVISQYERSC